MSKNKGFTLVEILAIMAVLGIMLILVVPQIGGSTNSKKEKELEKIVGLVENAGKFYHSFNEEEYKIPIDILVEEDYLTPDLEDPTTGKKLDGCVRVTKDSEGIFNYKYASCESIEVPLIVELNGGTTSQTFESTYYDSTKINLIDPTKAGNDFVKWEIVKGNSILSGKTLIIGDTETIIYALWESYPTLTVNLDGGITSQNFESVYKSGTTITLTSPTKTGYTFAGWEITSGNGVLSGNTFTMGSENTTIKAKWTINNYNITYNLNGGTLGTNAPTSGAYGSTVTVSNPTKTGYTFNGWTASGTGASMSGTNLTIGASDVTLTANWTVNTYTITYNLNGGTLGTNAPTSGTYGSTVTVSNPTKTGYTFNGWTVSGIGASMSGTNLTIGASDVTLTANWRANTYTITYNLDGGTLETGSPTSVTYGSTITLVNPTKTGYTFAGWTASSGVVSGNTFTPAASNTTLTAKWTVIYTITYNLNGGTKGSNSPTSGTSGSTITVSNPSKAGWTFNGWTVSGTGSSMSGTSLTIGTGNVTLTAKWTATLTTYIQYLYSNAASTNSLEKDTTSDANIRYVGSSPKNYINFNGESWRIIGVFEVTKSNGTKEKLVKIVRDASLGNMSWDSSASTVNSGYGVNEWNQADLQTMLNTYYLRTGTTCTYCNSINQPTCTNDCSSTVTPISSTYTNMIEEVKWSTGAIEYEGGGVIPVKTAYEEERGTTTGKMCTGGTLCNDTVVRKTTWLGKVGLIYPSDYGYASTDTNCRANIGYTTKYPCKNSNWLHNNSYYWTLSPNAYSSDAHLAMNVGSSGYVGNSRAHATDGVRPAVYLKYSVKITDGDGSSGNPYKLYT